MATLMVRDIDDEEYRRLVQTAKAHGRSVSAEVRAMIEENNRRARQREVAADFIAYVTANPMTLPEGEDAVSIIRKIRDEE